MDRSKKLTRQLGRYLGSETAEQDFSLLLNDLRSGSSGSAGSRLLTPLENMGAFLDAIDASYKTYEENLEVAERNLALSSAELMQANRSINALLNSLGQGFLTFDRAGICSRIYSKACVTLLETVPSGKPIGDVLRLNAEKNKALMSLLALVFGGSHAMKPEEVLRFAPKTYAHSAGRIIELDYKVSRKDEGGTVESIIVIATDVTQERRAMDLAEERKALFESMERALRDRRSFGSFMRHVDDMASALDQTGTDQDWTLLLREIHTLKGGAGSFRLPHLATIFHAMETDVVGCIEKSTSASLWAATVQKYQTLLREEITVIVERFRTTLGIDVLELEDQRHYDKKQVYDFARFLHEQGQTAMEQAYIRRVCAESLRGCLQPFEVRLFDLAERFNKKMHPLRFVGEDVMIVRDHYQPFLASLIHLFRNIIDHGIETPKERLAQGKDPDGCVTITTHLETDAAQKEWVVLSFQDDGAGVDVNRLRLKLLETEPDGGWATADDATVVGRILSGTISAKETVTQYSGRGVGMRAVYDEVLKIGGTMTVSSVRWQGTTTTIRLPYHLTIDAL